MTDGGHTSIHLTIFPPSTIKNKRENKPTQNYTIAWIEDRMPELQNNGK